MRNLHIPVFGCYTGAVDESNRYIHVHVPYMYLLRWIVIVLPRPVPPRVVPASKCVCGTCTPQEHTSAHVSYMYLMK